MKRFVLFLIGSALCAQSVSARPRLTLPEGVFYYQPAASVFGGEATWINPGALGRFGVSGFQLMGDYFNGGVIKSWGTVVYRERTSFAYRRVDNPGGTDYEEYIFALGMPLGKRMQFGGSYRYFDKGPGIFNNRHLWNLGFSGNAGASFRWGAVFSNLNRGRINGERSEMEMRYSLSYRPFDDRFTVSADMFLSTGTRLGDARWVYHGEFVPTRGLYINGLIDSDGNFTLGARVNLLRYFVGAKTRFTKGFGERGTTAYIGATNRRQQSVIRQRQRRLNVRVSGRPEENPAHPVFGPRRTSFLRTLLGIYRAAKDPSVAELLLDVKGAAVGFGQAQELREAIHYFRSQGKRATCYLTGPNNIGYYIASAADSILIPPVSQLNLTGLRAELTFYAGTLEKLGVKIDMMRIGEYKTAAEAFTRKASTEENRAQVNRLLDDIYAQFVQGIAAGRGLSVDSVQQLIDRGPFTSEEARRIGLVDGLTYRDQLTDLFENRLPTISYRRYASDTLINDDWRERPALAIVVAEGDIGSNNQRDLFGARAGITPATLQRAFRQMQREHRVRGVVLRVNSPGGFALAGEEIHRTVERMAEKKPLVVSMSSVAASAGYYIATPAKEMFANAGTITGSIGIFGGKADFSGLYDKLDLGKELYTRGRFAGMLTTVRPFTAAERQKYFSQLQAFYRHFVHLVAESRQLPEDSVDALGRGRVWTGQEARANGLVDRLGGIVAALETTADEAGIDRYDVTIYPQNRPLFELPGIPLLGSLAKLLTGEKGKEKAGAGILLGEDEILLARLPFDISIE